MQFYTRIDGVVYGPYTQEAMQTFVAEGRITLESEVSTDGQQWATAAAIEQIFPPMSDQSLSLFGYYLNCWKKYCVMKGRARRRELGAWVLFNSIIMVPFCIAVISGGETGTSNPPFPLVGSIAAQIFGFASLLPGISVVVRRFHDLNFPGSLAVGYFILVYLSRVIPQFSMSPAIFWGINFLSMVVSLLLLFRDGTSGPNRFGESPKGGIPHEKDDR